jgi:sigma-E factor negative regulatory protein RseA
MNGQGPGNTEGTGRHELALEARQALSALMDGDADDGMVTRACAAWRSEVHARADWHTYHVIGDVLRTADQCPSSRGDAAFVEALRRRLEMEPVVVAPATVAAAAPGAAVGNTTGVAKGRRGGWRAPIAAAAGVAAVAGVVFLMRPGTPDAQAPLVATAPAAAPATAAASVQTSAPVLVGTREAAPREAAPIVVVRDPGMLRDERLDRYLDAHRQFAESALSVMPAGTVRGVSTLAPER